MTANDTKTIPITSKLALAVAATVVALLASPPARAAGGARVGVAAAVNPDATGQPPSQRVRQLVIGANVVSDERIRTQANGRAQMVFLDGSSLTIGPNADMVIDKFVYDPDAKTGEMVISATKGIFRLVGGRISKNSAIQFKTPNAQIGIRGGVAIIEVGATTRATFLFGKEMQVTSGGQTRRVTRSGFTILVPVAGEPPLDPVPVTQVLLADSLTLLEGSLDPETTELEIPLDDDIEDTQLADLGSDEEPLLLTTTTSDGDPLLTDALPPPEPTLTEDTVFLSGTSEGTCCTTSGFTSTSGFSGRYKSAPATGPNKGTKDGDGNYNRALGGGVISGGRFSAGAAGGGIFSLPVGAPGSALQFSASEGSSPFGRVSGKSFLSADGQFVYFDMLEVDNSNTRSTAFAGKPTPLSAIPTSGTTSYLLTSDFVLNSNVAFIRGIDGGTIAGAPGGDEGGIIWNSSGSRGNFAFLHAEVNGNGGSQKSVVSLMGGLVLLDGNGRPYLTGQMRGSAQLSGATSPLTMYSPIASTPDGNGKHFYGSNSPKYFALQAATVNPSTGATSPSAATILTGTAATSYFPNSYAIRPTNNDPFIIDPRNSRTLRGFAAGMEWHLNSSGGVIGIVPKMTTDSDPGNVSVKTVTANNSMSAIFDLANPGTATNRRVVRFGDGVTPTGRSLFIDDRAFGAIESATASTIGGSTAVNTYAYMFSDEVDGDFASSSIFCHNCDALAWGFWGARLIAGNGDHHVTHLGSWVAGDMPSASAIAGLTGTATYAGHVVGTVNNGGSTYLAAGSFQTTWNFGTRNGSTNITSFDGANYSGTVVDLGTGMENRFSGSLTGGMGRVGNLDGAFYRTHGTANGSMGGQIKFSGSGYDAVTTFAATRH